MALDRRVPYLGSHLPWVWVTRNCMWLFLMTTVVWSMSAHAGYKGGGDPEFDDLTPVKNISSPAGSNIDLNCNVKNLNGHRIMWVKKESIDRTKPSNSTNGEILLAINALKITKNPKVSVSLLQSSGDLSQSILYIYNIGKEDDGVYHCIVNTSPMIVQVGTLEVKSDPPEPVQVPLFSPRPTVPVTRRPETTSEQSVTTTHPSRNGDEEIIGGGGQGENPDISCIDMKKIWRDTKYLFSWVVSKLRNIF